MKADLALRALRALKDGGKTTTKENLEALRLEVFEARDEYARSSIELAKALCNAPKSEAQRSDLKNHLEEARSLEQGLHELAGRISSAIEARRDAA